MLSEFDGVARAAADVVGSSAVWVLVSSDDCGCGNLVVCSVVACAPEIQRLRMPDTLVRMPQSTSARVLGMMLDPAEEVCLELEIVDLDSSDEVPDRDGVVLTSAPATADVLASGTVIDSTTDELVRDGVSSDDASDVSSGGNWMCV